MPRFIITKDGHPDWNNSLEMPCTNRLLAELEVDRLRMLNANEVQKAKVWKYSGRGSAFTAPDGTVHQFEVKQVGD